MSGQPQAIDVVTLVRKLRALPEPAMREAVLAEQLRALSPDEAATIAGEIVRRAPSGAPYDVALLSLSAILDGDRLSYDERSAIYTVARERGDILLVRLLLSPQDAPVGAPPPIAIPGRPDITLGERKSLARTRSRELIDRMLRDSDPSVLEILLENPRVTESDVVRLAARRPTTAEAQRTIFRAPRFRVRYAVRRAIILNPYTPSDLASQLVGLLEEQDLRRVQSDASLPDAVRASARAQLAQLLAGRQPR
jgi:hypothetical protein